MGLPAIGADRIRRLARPAGLVGLALFVALPFLNRPRLVGGDEPHYLIIAHALLTPGDLDLGPIYDRAAAGGPEAGAYWSGRELDHHAFRVDGREIPAHPIGMPLLVAPLLGLRGRFFPGVSPDVVVAVPTILLMVAAIRVGWRLLRERTGDSRAATRLTFALAFATPAWFYGRTFFTEPWLVAVEVLAMAAFARGRWIAGSAGLGLLLLIKESVFPLVGAALLFAWFRHGFPVAMRWAIGPTIAVGLFLVKNRWVAGEWWSTFQPWATGDPFRGLLGCLFGPRHGLLTFAPIAVVALVGVVAIRRKAGGARVLPSAALIGFLAMLAMTAAWRMWWGGSCHGFRLLLPTLPALAVLLLEAHEAWGERRLFRRIFEIATVVGFAWQWAAITHPFHAFWSMSLGELATRYPGYIATGALLAVGFLLFLERWFPTREPPAAS